MDTYTAYDTVLLKAKGTEKIIAEGLLSSGSPGSPGSPGSQPLLSTSEIRDKIVNLEHETSLKTTYDTRSLEVEKRFPIEPLPLPLDKIIDEGVKKLKMGKR
jgi:hypothetical protein